ncbi:MAG TPA: ribonuclease P protein component [Candidatus Sulfotelmatobacter sp.]|nr:ribonuclease P protein component [Candidatus Sulfotelmatobacter sp.]
MSALAPKEESNRKTEPRGKKIGFPRSRRLLRHADFERVYKQGRRHFSASLTVFYLARAGAEPRSKTASQRNGGQECPPHTGPRVGFTVGRALGGAVVRNRMKRRLREAVRLAGVAQAGDVDVVINPKKCLLTNEFGAVLNEVARAFVVIEQKVGSTR